MSSTSAVSFNRFPSEVRIGYGQFSLSGRYQSELSNFIPVTIKPELISRLAAVDSVLKSDMETLFFTAVHPTKSRDFRNPLVSHEAFNNISTAALAGLEQARGNYTYINQAIIPHHPHIGRHVLAVASVAMAIGSVLGLSSVEVKNCISCALLHDGSKIAELLRERMQELRLNPEEFGLTQGKEIEGILLGAGVPAEYITKLNRAAGLTGHLSLARFIEDDEKGGIRLVDGMLIEKVVHLADDLVSESSLMPLNDRMIRSKFSEKYGYLWQTGIPRIGCYADLQVMVTEAISAEFIKNLNISATEDPNLYLTSVIAAKLKELKMAA